MGAVVGDGIGIPGSTLRLRTDGFAVKLKLQPQGLNGGSLGTESGLSIGGGPVITHANMGMHIGRIAPTTIWGTIRPRLRGYHQIPFPDMGIGSVRLMG